MGSDEEAEEQDKRDGDEQLRSDIYRAVMVMLSAGGAAHRATAFDHGARTVCADQVLAAHLETPSDSGTPGDLGVIWRLGCQFPPRLFRVNPGYPLTSPSSRDRVMVP